MLEIAPFFVRNNDCIPLLVELETNGLLSAIQNEYWYWDKVKYKSRSHSPEEIWQAVKFHRWLKGTAIKFGGYRFSFVLTEFMQRSIHQFDLHIGGNLGSNIGIAETDKNKFLISSIMEEAIASSQMEGANTTREKAKEMIQNEQRPRNKSEQMILNNFITMQHIVAHNDDVFTPEAILNIHKLISNKTLNNAADEGAFRDNDEIYVIDHTQNEIAHTPPPFTEIDSLIKELCAFCNTDGSPFIHPIIKGCIVHFMIGWIHPFNDGNGRTARALFYWYMLKQGYWLTEYLSISRIIKDSKAAYEKAYLYSEIDDFDLSYFVTYHLETMYKALEALKQYISRKQKEVFQAAQFMKIPGVNDRMAQILKLVKDDPERILTSREMDSRFNVSNFTSRTDLKALVELGFLEIVQVNKKKQNFIRSKNFESICKEYKLL